MLLLEYTCFVNWRGVVSSGVTCLVNWRGVECELDEIYLLGVVSIQSRVIGGCGFV